MIRPLSDNARAALRVWNRLDKRSCAPDRCWPLLNAVGEGVPGYGAIYVGKRHLRAHRVIWEYFKGPIAKGLVVCHSCDNPPCCNPSHLFLGTQKDNVQDMISKGRRGNVGFPTKLSADDIKEIMNRIETERPRPRYQDLAAEYEISVSYLKQLVRGKHRAKDGARNLLVNERFGSGKSPRT